MPDEVTDAKGESLMTGDTVRSIQTFDRGQRHVGIITDINDDLITILHVGTCCEPGRCSESKANWWERLTKRPTAWERLLKEDDEILDSSR